MRRTRSSKTNITCIANIERKQQLKLVKAITGKKSYTLHLIGSVKMMIILMRSGKLIQKILFFMGNSIT